jgi:hypothetical protein
MRWSIETSETSNITSVIPVLSGHPVYGFLNISANWLLMHGIKVKHLWIRLKTAENCYSFFIVWKREGLVPQQLSEQRRWHVKIYLVFNFISMHKYCINIEKTVLSGYYRPFQTTQTEKNVTYIRLIYQWLYSSHWRTFQGNKPWWETAGTPVGEEVAEIILY